jgi:predicted DNA-binding protein (MmcQ/YjbR family)
MTRLERLRTFALTLPGTTVIRQWGECLVFKVAGKVFLVVAEEAGILLSLSFKCTPAEFDELTDIDGIRQAPYFARRHWVQLEDPAALPDDSLSARIRRSYDLVVAGLTKKLRAGLG